MIKQVTTLIFSLTLILNQINGQTFKEQFYSLLSESDTTGQKELLVKWEKANKNDAELFVAYFNYYVNKGRNEMITLGQDSKGEDVFVIMDQDTNVKEPAGYLYSDIYYDRELINKGIEWINKGIKKHPNRLDMRFGKVYIYGELDDYENFTKEIINTIKYSKKNKNRWTWSDNEPVEDGKEFMLGVIQDYVIQLYNTGNEALFNNMKDIAETVLDYYPDHIESLSNLAIVHILQGNYDEALKPLLKAEKLNPKDYIVLNNIAHAYKLKGDTKNAIKYYELMKQYGDEETQQYAQEQIDELNQ